LVEGNGTLSLCTAGYYEYWDGTQFAYEKNNNTAMDLGGQWYADVSYGSLNFGAGQTVRRYTVGLYSYNSEVPGSTRYLISDVRTYEIQQDCPAEYAKQILWLDNVWETFIFNAEIQEEVDRDYEEFRIALSFTPTQQDILNQIINIELKKITTAKTRWINKEHFDWLLTMLKSSDVRLYEDGLFKSIYITKFDYKLDSIESLYKVEIDYVVSAGENQINNS